MKKFLSVILAALILVCPLSGFAANEAETLEWYFCDDSEDCDPWFYNCKGNIGLGETEIKFTEKELCDYYTFNAEKTGYYYVECSDYEIDWFGFPETIKDGKAFREAEGYYVSDSYVEKKMVYKLDAGETVFGIDFLGSADPSDTYKFEISYLGDAIKDIVLEENALEDLVLEYDLFNSDASYTRSDVEVVFSGGKTIKVKDVWVLLEEENYNWVKGENKATAVFMDFEKDVVVTACEMYDLISDVEFVNFDEFKNVITTFNDNHAVDIYGAELIFTLADGEKITLNTNDDDCIEINGREYCVYAFYTFNDAEDVIIEIYTGGVTIKHFSCDVTKSSYVDGSGMLFTSLGSNMKDSFFFSRVAFSEFLRMYDIGDLEDAFSEASYYFRRSFESFINCFTLVRLFMEYYF